MKEGTIYDLATGRIEMTVVAPDEEGVKIQIIGKPGLGIYFDNKIDGANFYINEGKVLERPSMSLSLTDEVYLSVGEVIRIEGIPEECDVSHPGGVTQVNDGFVEWSSVEPGDFTLSFSKFPYKEVTINAIVR